MRKKLIARGLLVVFILGLISTGCSAPYTYYTHKKEMAKIEKQNQEATGRIEKKRKDKMMQRDYTTRRPCNLGIVHVKYESANLHEKPGLAEQVVGQVSRSTDLKAITETDYWLLVEKPTGKKGWIAKDWVVEDI